MPGWQYSSGCAAEFEMVVEHGIRAETLEGIEITRDLAIALLLEAAKKIEAAGAPVPRVLTVASALGSVEAHNKVLTNVSATQYFFRKDESLDKLAERINVAQFISFSPGLSPRQEFSRVLGREPNTKFPTLRAGLEELLQASSEGSINVRSFQPDSPQSHEFIYGIKSLDAAQAAVERLSLQGLYVIANETIDVHDGGVSGVALGGVIEFAPDDTPRCVEKPGVASLPRRWGLAMLAVVYRFPPEIAFPESFRLEFSIHPKKRGWKNTQTLGWELEKIGYTDIRPRLLWPNKFSRLLGDKIFGQLVADQIGLPVPRTIVFNRRVAPFEFGWPTGTTEVWLRTCPQEQVPGKYATTRGWIDPFALMTREDPTGEFISSVVAQSGISSRYSGGAVVDASHRLVVEGRQGDGQQFMRGEASAEKLPERVVEDVRAIYTRAGHALGPVRFEWVHDGDRAWVVQLHLGATQSTETVIVPGEPSQWVRFDLKHGLEALRERIRTLPEENGLVLVGQVGLTSHIADIVRKAAVPARISTTP
jgi:hypothetical protein